MSNKRLNKTIQKALKHNSSRGGQCLWLDAYNNAVFDEFAPTIRTTIQTSCMNFIMEIEETNKEPKICAMRGRSDGEWHESEHEQRIECREDGVTNTITGVSKDNMVAEPIIIANTAGFGQCYESKDVSPTVKSSAFQYNNALLEPIEQIPLNADKDGLATTVTTAHHYSGNIVDPKRGQKEMGVMEVIKEQIVLNACKDGTAATLKSENMRASDKCITEPIGGFAKMGVLERHHQQDFVQHEDGISRALCAGSHGSASHLTKTMVSSNLGFRVRRLTERELFRLMDVSEEDIDKIQAAGISKTQQAKMAGNSIVCACMYHIFRKLFIDTNEENEQLSLF